MGSDAANYTFVVPNAWASITPATLTASVAANNKVYDGSPGATGSITAFAGVIGGDSVALNSATASYSFANSAAASSKVVTQAGATLTGTDAVNYQLIVRNGMANITPVPAIVSILDAIRPAGAPNPAFQATYNGPPLPGIQISRASFEHFVCSCGNPSFRRRILSDYRNNQLSKRGSKHSAWHLDDHVFQYSTNQPGPGDPETNDGAAHPS